MFVVYVSNKRWKKHSSRKIKWQMNITQHSISIVSTRGTTNYSGGHRGTAWVLQQPGFAEEKGGACTQARLFEKQNKNSVNIYTG